MTVKVYISRNPDGTEHHFRETYERNAALQIAKIFWRIYHPVKSKLYTLIFNVQKPPADLIILSNDGLGVVDMKHIGNPVEGNEQGPWYVIDSDGRRTEIKNSHGNPAKQVGDYKRAINTDLKSFAVGTSLPPWLHKEEFRTQGAILFTSDRFPKTGIKLSPNYGAWLKICWLDDIADWSHELSFQPKHGKQSFRLNNTDIESIATKCFQTSPWTEIDGFLVGNNPYGFLFVIEGKQKKVRLSLETEVVRIGRSRDNNISLESSYVSGQHCKLSYMPDGLFLEDLGSTNGTWLNGSQLTIREKRKVKSYDEIVLAPDLQGEILEHSIVLKYIAAGDSNTAPTKIYKD